MARDAKNFDHLLGGNAKGLSDLQLKAHFTLYQGYVKKLNEIREKLGAADRSAPNYSFNEYSELRRREPVAYNGTFLHEAYFDNLAAPGQAPSEAVKQAIAVRYGSWESWIADVKAALLSGHGWVLTVWGHLDGRLHNNLIQSEHHVGLMPNTHVLLAIDAWEHAYFLDYGTRKADYIASVIESINWKVVDERFVAATHK